MPTFTCPTNNMVSFASCPCGWEWQGSSERGATLAMKLHKKKCVVCQNSTHIRQDTRSGDRDADPEKKTLGKNARKKLRKKEKRSALQESRDAALAARKTAEVANGDVSAPENTAEWEATIAAVKEQEKVALLVDEEGRPIGLVGDPTDPAYIRLKEALEADGWLSGKC